MDYYSFYTFNLYINYNLRSLIRFNHFNNTETRMDGPGIFVKGGYPVVVQATGYTVIQFSFHKQY